MEIQVLSPSEAFYWLANIARNTGSLAEPRGYRTMEAQNVTCIIKYPHILPVQVLGRNLKPFIGSVEALQLIGQCALPELVLDGAKVMEQYMDDGIFSGAYGQRVYGQLSAAERVLLDDRSTRQAVVTIYDGRHDMGSWNGYRPFADIPCTLALQFLWEPSGLTSGGKALSLRVSMRSNDVWLGLPYDLFQFINLQMAMADALRVPVGSYIHTVGSLHAYEKDWDSIDALANPGSATADEKRYVPRWNVPPDMGIGWVSGRARSALLGRPLPDATPWELALAAPIELARVPA